MKQMIIALLLSLPVAASARPCDNYKPRTVYVERQPVQVYVRHKDYGPTVKRKSDQWFKAARYRSSRY